MFNKQSVAVILPALNEARSIAQVIKALTSLQNSQGQQLLDDIVVCDNGSTDDTAQLAKEAGARIVYEAERGYGAACLAALAVLQKPDIVVFVDADRSIRVNELLSLLQAIENDADIVIGSRSLGYSESGSLSPQQRFGNALACYLIQLFWHKKITDLGPFRVIRYESLLRLGMKDRRCGWTVEMQIKAIQTKLNMHEVPVSSIRRLGRSKISGTLKGTLIAGHDILSMIIRLAWQDLTQKKLFTNSNKATFISDSDN